MTKIYGVIIAGALAVFASRAWAEDAPPPTPGPSGMTPNSAPPPSYGTVPSADDQRRAVEMAPPNVMMGPPMAGPCAPPCAAPSTCGTCPRCAPCGREACAQARDACGWPIWCDPCGGTARLGCLEIELQGSYNWMSSPDGQLGELVAGNTAPLDWNDVDYPGRFGGRATISYRYAPFHRVELRGSYYGDPDDTQTRSGFFGATPGATGTGDLSRPVDAAMHSEAKAWSGELNWWNELLCEGKMRYDWGFGARYVHLEETAHVDFVTTGPGPFPVANGFVDSNVKNDFGGIQANFMAHTDWSAAFETYASVKVMIGNVHKKIDVSDNSIFAGGAHSSSSKDDQIVGGAEFELGAKYRINKHISIAAAGSLLFLDNVQRAEDSLDFSHSTTGAVQAKQAPDQLLIESVYLGVIITF